MSIAFIVDGTQEKRIVQRLCEGAPVRMTMLNGKDVKIAAITKAVISLAKLLKGRHFPIVIVVDREGRPESSIDMEAQIKAGIVSAGYDARDIIVSCPDLMVENWILAGNPRCASGRTILDPSCGGMDGLNGKSRLKNELRGHNIAYNETGNGVELFCNMDFHGAAGDSDSFGRLFRLLKTFCPRFSA